MTLKRRRNHGQHDAERRIYRFVTNSREYHYKAESLNEAKNMFQEQFGFYPDIGVNYLVPPPTVSGDSND